MTALTTLLLALPAAQAGGSGAAVGEGAVSGSALLQREPARAAPEYCPSARRAIRFYSAKEREWRAKMGAGAVDRTVHERPPSCTRVRRLALRAQARARAARQAFEVWFERTYSKWRCIHEHEGAWNDPDPPHYGGLQFDDDFQRSYGPEFFRRWGDAGNWPVWAQLVAAERAYRTRGFGPWPNTARACGLL